MRSGSSIREVLIVTERLKFPRRNLNIGGEGSFSIKETELVDCGN